MKYIRTQQAATELKVDPVASFSSGCMLDPLEQAIDQAVRLAAESKGELALRLSRHLDALLDEQLKKVSA